MSVEDPGLVDGRGELDTVLFDLDGTLIDSRDLILSSFRHTMDVHLGWVPPDKAWLANMGRPLITQLRGFADTEEQAQEMMDTYRFHNRREHDRSVRPFQGMSETLRQLRAAGYRLGIVTSKMREMAIRGLETCGLGLEWFSAFVTADDPVPHKPDPAPVTLALERAGGAQAGRALFVGDSVWDLKAGRAAGTATGAALWGPFGRDELAEGSPDYWLTEPSAIGELLL